jgi:RNA polymerase sigma factor (sigma-70 family)
MSKEIRVGGADSSATSYLFERSMKETHASLTAREREIIRLIADGNTYVHIAELLSISPQTVIVHRKSAMRKLKARNIANLIKIAMDIKVI